MWSLYGEGKNAVCIFTTEDKLESQVQKNQDIDKLIVKPVTYINHENAQFDSDPLTPFTAKSLPFTFEKEVRLIAYHSQKNIESKVKNDKPGVALSINSLSQFIDKLVVSPNSYSWFIDSVKKLCLERDLNVEVRKSSLCKKRFTDIFDVLENLNFT
ncbi:hypothetical protein BMI79_03065 [Serratia oryzae]|uniref:DUF2971 domain-containing protein n=2 Tax=Serratia oryzae TaxID=2034155 RepID=A0A1S8CPW0_9GAMM|nr:hypothetical protein BMI79_03065 [Serratia oryzae]